MISFDDVQSTPLPISPVAGGTDQIFLTKVVYDRPVDKSERLILTLEHRVAGKKTEVSAQFLNTVDFTNPENKDELELVLRKLLHFIETFRPELPELELKAKIQGETWEQVLNNIIALLPPNYSELPTTWALYYGKNSDFLSIPKYPPFVKLGNGGSFKFNPQYDFLVPQAKATPQPDQFNPMAIGGPQPEALFGAPKVAPPVAAGFGAPQVSPDDMPF